MVKIILYTLFVATMGYFLLLLVGAAAVVVVVCRAIKVNFALLLNNKNTWWYKLILFVATSGPYCPFDDHFDHTATCASELHKLSCNADISPHGVSLNFLYPDSPPDHDAWLKLTFNCCVIMLLAIEAVCLRMHNCYTMWLNNDSIHSLYYPALFPDFPVKNWL